MSPGKNEPTEPYQPVPIWTGPVAFHGVVKAVVELSLPFT
jgi:hypothetical protein